MDIFKRVFDKVNSRSLVDFTVDLVNIESPTGRESEAAEYVGRRLAELGCEVKYQEVETNRKNVVCTLRGSGGGPALMFCGHLDCAAPRPRRARIEGEWIWGNGVTNMKSAFSAYYGALKALADSDTKLKGDILVTGVVGELEVSPVGDYRGPAYSGAGLGARYMLHHGVTSDFCIIGEPTGLKVQYANQGYIYAKITVKGTLGHAWYKERSLNAISKAAEVVKALEKWEETYQEKFKHPFMKPRLNIGGIDGGRQAGPSQVPPSCNLYLYLSTLPGQSITATVRELKRFLRELEDKDPALKMSVEIYHSNRGYEIPSNSPLVQKVAEAHRRVFKKDPAPIENPFRFVVSSDGVHFADYGIPTVTYGPAGISRRGNHINVDEETREEVPVNISNLVACTKVYAASAMMLCGQEQ